MSIRKIRIGSAVLAATLVAAGMAAPAHALQTQSNVARQADDSGSSPTRAAPRREQRICVASGFSGSRIARNICRTRAEWERAGGLPTND